jgi:stage III sporulation protein AE
MVAVKKIMKPVILGYYVALESYLPETLSEILPEGLFDPDPQRVQQALSQLTSFSGFLGVILQAVGLHLADCSVLLASVLGLLLLCGMMRALGQAWNMNQATLVPRLCLYLAVAGAGYAAVDAMVGYFSVLQTFMQGMIPVMSTMYLLGGNVARASVGNVMLSVGLNVCHSICAGLAPPLFGACMAMALPAVMESGVDLSRISGFLKKGYTTVLGVLTFVLTLCLSAQNLIASRADSLAMRSGRYAIGQMIPIVGGALAGSLDTLAAGVGLLRGLAGMSGVLLLLICCIPVLVRMLLLRALFDLGSGVAHLLGCASESAVLGEASSLFGYMAAAVAMCSAVFIIAVGAFASCAAAWVT